ncbi:alkaline shock response membrane anchor protein AmaP [Pediococcus pentosaceus]|uniref:alkaline shock response membrane anchor protein AmaP n=1 Tax=Pediococcus pentosaceus TaxID=1255 RepID=UPI0022E02BF6|nr:alkaline shock response membrane anchor protein AmaP [Pediococcus pentosaceus]
MSRTSKILLSLMAVITLIQTVWFVSSEMFIPYLTDFFESMRTTNSRLTEVVAIVFGVIVALFALIMLIIALSSRTSEKDLKLQGGRGKLTIPKKSMEQIVDKSIAENHQVGNIQTKVRVRGNDRIQAQVSVEDISDGNYDVNAKEIQETVQDSIQRHLGMKSHVKVQIIPRKQSSKSLKVI